MKTKAQELIYCEGGTHCLGCGTKMESRFSLRCQVCWQEQAETPRDTSYKSVGPGSEGPRPSGCCVICAAPAFGAAIACRDCELNRGRGLLSAEQRKVVVLEGVCEKCKMRETQKDFKACLWCNLHREKRLELGKCMSCPEPISKLGTQKKYQCSWCIVERRYWNGRCELCYDPQEPGQITCKSCRETNHAKKFFDKYKEVEPETWEPIYKEISLNTGRSGTQWNA